MVIGTGKLIQPLNAGTFKHKDLLSDATLESEEAILEGDEKEKYLAFIRRTLQWRPETDRPLLSWPGIHGFIVLRRETLRRVIKQ
jgi:hypothetical protein